MRASGNAFEKVATAMRAQRFDRCALAGALRVSAGLPRLTRQLSTHMNAYMWMLVCSHVDMITKQTMFWQVGIPKFPLDNSHLPKPLASGRLVVGDHLPSKRRSPTLVFLVRVLCECGRCAHKRKVASAHNHENISSRVMCNVHATRQLRA